MVAVACGAGTLEGDQGVGAALRTAYLPQESLRQARRIGAWKYTLRRVICGMQRPLGH